MVLRIGRIAVLLAGIGATSAVLHGETASGRFARFSVEQGLSQSTVETIVQDHVGFLWLGTEEGLNRFDGYTFTTFRHESKNPGSLPNDRVTALYEDREGRLWVGTDGGLSLFDRRTETFAPTEVPQRVTGIVQDAHGTLWVAAEGYGLFERNPSTGAFARHQKTGDDPGSLASWVPSALLLDRRGRLWIGTKDAGLDQLADEDRGRFVHHRHDPRDPKSLAHDQVWGLAEDPEGNIWVATYGGGLSVLDPDTRAFRSLRQKAGDRGSLGSDLVTSVLVDGSGTVWAGTDGAGLQRYDLESQSFRAYMNEAGDDGSLSQNVVRSLYEDRQGQLWVGTYLGGASLMRKARHPFNHYRHDPRDATSLADSNVTSFLEDAQGRIWVGTGWGGLHQFDSREGTFTRYRLSPELRGTLCLLQDRRGRIWVGTYRGGLVRFDPRAGSASTRFSHVRGDSTTISSEEVWTMVEDGGALWLGTNDGVDRFDPDRGVVTAHYDTPVIGGLINPGTRALLLDREGNLWIGTLGGVHFLPKGQRTPVRIRPDDEALARDGVMALHQDGRGRIWIGTYGGGLKRLDDPTHAPIGYTVLPSNVVYGIQEDSAGNLWLSTNRGLYRFDPTTGEGQAFDLSSGLQSLQFNPEASLATRGGRLLFGSIDGFYDFDPAAIKPDTFAPPVAITGLRIFNEPVRTPGAMPSLDQITLSHQDKVFSLEFAALDFTLPRNNAYAYRMRGFSDQWLPLGNRRDVTFTNLDPATYVFEVKATNSDGIWSETGKASLRVIVTPPLWRTWWFRSLALAAATAALLAAYRARVRRLTVAVAEETRAELAARRAEERYRSIFEDGEAELRAAFRRSEMMSAMGMLVAGVAHEVRNPLFGISANLDTFEAKLGDDRDRFAPLISRMRMEVERLARLMRELLEYGKPVESERAYDSIEAVVREGLASCAALAAENGVGLTSSIPEDLPLVSMDRVRLVQVFENLIQNAVQHSPQGGTVRVSARQEKTDGCATLALTITDSGRGFAQEDLPHAFEPFFTRRRGGTGLGLAIVQHIVEAHGGTVGAVNRPEGGAAVTVTLPAAGAAVSPST